MGTLSSNFFALLLWYRASEHTLSNYSFTFLFLGFPDVRPICSSAALNILWLRLSINKSTLQGLTRLHASIFSLKIPKFVSFVFLFLYWIRAAQSLILIFILIGEWSLPTSFKATTADLKTYFENPRRGRVSVEIRWID